MTFWNCRQTKLPQHSMTSLLPPLTNENLASFLRKVGDPLLPEVGRIWSLDTAFEERRCRNWNLLHFCSVIHMQVLNSFLLTFWLLPKWFFANFTSLGISHSPSSKSVAVVLLNMAPYVVDIFPYFWSFYALRWLYLQAKCKIAQNYTWY
jgi:hypothetical protein